MKIPTFSPEALEFITSEAYPLHMLSDTAIRCPLHIESFHPSVGEVSPGFHHTIAIEIGSVATGCLLLLRQGELEERVGVRSQPIQQLPRQTVILELEEAPVAARGSQALVR